MAGAYNPKEIEPGILGFWESSRIFEKAVQKNKGKRVFYFIDGPPYTSGAIHIGHAWNKSLKDCILRYKRMKGFDVWSQPGFDMHGLPIEVAVEKRLGIRDKREIVEKVGIRQFIDECEKFSLEQMHPMIKDFSRLGVWMDWANPYMSIKNEYIEGAWWALSQADRNGYLYEGKKSMTWCPRCATALAKHELTYKNVNDRSVFVKFPVTGRDKEFLVVWTTTPWTLPFNMAVMAHPEFEYVKVNVQELGEDWIIAKPLAKTVIEGICNLHYEIREELKGIDLKGMGYKSPFHEEIAFHMQHGIRNAYTVVMSAEFVDLSSGTGLVHTAPGCGPEDFEIGRRNGLPAFNTVDETGKFTEAGPYDGLFAKKDDEAFIKELEKKGLLAAVTQVTHEYAHCWRCETPVIFRATEQWFLAVEKLRDEMLEENGRVRWVPDWAGSRWFDSWLQNLQDWCISRQRFWGIPLPIWRCTACSKTRIIGSRKELPVKMDNLHRPWIDEVFLKCSCGSDMKRVSDVLDVWLDSGAASWAPLNYPSETGLFEGMWPADFILEGKDQIRGWFNSLICLSMVSLKRNCYKAVYMHGFVNDALGRKMSKSLKNTISPYEVIDSYGADTLRYYSIGGAKPGFDLNYNFDDMKLKHKNLMVFWNIQNFLLELAGSANIDGEKELSVEERYILSRLHSSIKGATYMFDSYYINEVPWIVEDLLLELSRTYIQLTRDKAGGSEIERDTVLHTAFTVFFESLKLIAPIAPFIAEQMYQNLRKEFDFAEESIHLYSWPDFDKEIIDEQLEKDFGVAKSAIQAVLAAREKVKLGIRWPLKEAIIVTNELQGTELVESIRKQANVKEVIVTSGFDGVKTSVKADYEKLLPQFGQKRATSIIAALALTSPETLLKYLERDGKYSVSLDDGKVTLTMEHMIIAKQPPHGYEYALFEQGEVYINIISTPELEAEGFARELIRRVQNMRKEAGLKKSQSISLWVKCGDGIGAMLRAHASQVKDKVGAGAMEISSSSPGRKFMHEKVEKIREHGIGLFLDVNFS
ncbi:isoleucine--tRNA ligase [Candidatus Woesearchaeota archaeon]|nr:isoleucine--tRNA ligase [Candidatus Woesearchaeota archaeon]